MGFFASLARLFQVKAELKRVVKLSERVEKALEAGDLAGAVTLYADMKLLGDDAEAFRQERAAAARKLVAGYTKVENLAAARDIYYEMAVFGGEWSIRYQRLEALDELMRAYAHVGDVAAVRELGDALDVLADADDDERRAWAAERLVTAHLKAGDTAAAREVYNLPVFERPEARTAQAWATSDLFEAAVKAEDMPTAEALLAKLKQAGKDVDYAKNILPFSANYLLEIYLANEDPVAAQRIYDDVTVWGGEDAFDRNRRMYALCKLICVYAKVGDKARAAELYASMDEYAELSSFEYWHVGAELDLIKDDPAKLDALAARLATPENSALSLETRASILQAQVRSRAGRGDCQGAAAAYEAMAALGPKDEIKLERLDAAEELAKAWARAGDAAKAAETYAGMAALGSGGSSDYLRLDAASELLEIWADAGDVANAAEMYAAVEGFADIGEDAEDKEDIVETRLGALYNLIRAHLSAGDFGSAHELCRRFDTFTDPRTGDFLEKAREAIREAEAKA